MNDIPRVLKRLSDFRNAPLPRIPSRSQRRKEAEESDEYDTDLDADGDDEPVTGSSVVDVKAIQSQTDSARSVARGHDNIPSGRQDTVNPTALALTLLKNTALTHLDLSNSFMGFDGGKEVIAALTVNDCIVHVDLSNNRLGNTGISALLGKLLENNEHIKKLTLSHNDLSDEDAKYLSCGLETNASIRVMDVSHNSIGEEGAKYLMQALAWNDVLEVLDLNWNHVRKTGAVALGAALKKNTSLEKLHLAWNGLAYEGTLALRDVLKVNIHLVELDIASNRINWDGAELLAEALESNYHLETLRAGNNPLTTTGSLDIAKSVAANSNSALTLLDLTAVPVVHHFELVCDDIAELRPDFKAIHGGMVKLHDVFGQKTERRIHPMQKIIDYMYRKEMRPIELMRSFDKEAKFLLTADEFIDRLKSAGIEIKAWETDELKKYVTDQGGQPGAFISYKKLIESITKQIETERNHRIDLREKSLKTKNFQEDILDRPRETTLVPVDMDKAITRLTGIKQAAVGSTRALALKIVSDSVEDRRKRSFESKMAAAASFRQDGVVKQSSAPARLLRSETGTNVTPLLQGSQTAAELLNGRRLWMSSLLGNVHVRSSLNGTIVSTVKKES